MEMVAQPVFGSCFLHWCGVSEEKLVAKECHNCSVEYTSRLECASSVGRV